MKGLEIETHALYRPDQQEELDFLLSQTAI
jgi:hypothetical protein